MKSSIFTPADYAADLREKLALVESQMKDAAKYPTKVNLTGNKLTDKLIRLGCVELREEYSKGFSDIIDYDAMSNEEEALYHAKRLVGLIADIHPGTLTNGVPKPVSGDVGYLISGPSWFVVRVVQEVNGRWKLWVPFNDDDMDMGLVAIN